MAAAFLRPLPYLALLVQLLVAFGHNLFTSAFFSGVNNFLSPPFAHSQFLAHRAQRVFSKENVVNSVG